MKLEFHGFFSAFACGVIYGDLFEGEFCVRRRSIFQTQARTIAVSLNTLSKPETAEAIYKASASGAFHSQKDFIAMDRAGCCVFLRAYWGSLC